MSIGIIGLGFVGIAIEKFFSSKISVFTYDINKKCSEKSLADLLQKTDLIFICLPTPMNKNGSCNISIIENVLLEINELSSDKEIHIVIKSTIPIGTTDYFSQKFPKLNICFNPEFLTEKNSFIDFENQKKILIGKVKNYHPVENLYHKFFPNSKIELLLTQECEIIKYISNSFLALKVSYANEIFELCNALKINYSNIVNILKSDERLGPSHWNVPGADNKRGYGGSCFPKDMASLIFQFELNKINPIILKSSWERNIAIDRKEKDWENLIGRSVVSDFNND